MDDHMVTGMTKQGSSFGFSVREIFNTQTNFNFTRRIVIPVLHDLFDRSLQLMCGVFFC